MNKEVQTQILAAISSLQAKQEELMSHATLLSASKDHGNQSQDIIKFQNDVAQISSKIQEIISRLETCEKQQDDLEQYSRRNCVILHGCSSVPETEYHKFEDFVVKTLNDSLKPNHPIVNTDIDITHKLKSRSPKNPIIIKFVRRSTKNMVYGRKKELKGSGLSITESLTRSRLKLLSAAKEAFGKQKVSTMNGIIYAYLDKSSLDHITKHSSLAEGIERTQNPLRKIKEKERQLLVEIKPVLQKFLHDKLKLQLYALYAVQVFCCNKEFPKDLLLRLFNGLYEEDVVDRRLTMCGRKMLMNSIVGRGRHCSDEQMAGLAS